MDKSCPLDFEKPERADIMSIETIVINTGPTGPTGATGSPGSDGVLSAEGTTELSSTVKSNLALQWPEAVQGLQGYFDDFEHSSAPEGSIGDSITGWNYDNTSGNGLSEVLHNEGKIRKNPDGGAGAIYIEPAPPNATEKGLGFKPYRVGAEFAFDRMGNENVVGALMVFIVSKDQSNLLNTMYHIHYNYSYCTIEWWEGGITTLLNVSWSAQPGESPAPKVNGEKFWCEFDFDTRTNTIIIRNPFGEWSVVDPLLGTRLGTRYAFETIVDPSEADRYNPEFHQAWAIPADADGNMVDCPAYRAAELVKNGGGAPVREDVTTSAGKKIALVGDTTVDSYISSEDLISEMKEATLDSLVSPDGLLRVKGVDYNETTNELADPVSDLSFTVTNNNGFPDVTASGLEFAGGQGSNSPCEIALAPIPATADFYLAMSVILTETGNFRYFLAQGDNSSTDNLFSLRAIDRDLRLAVRNEHSDLILTDAVPVGGGVCDIIVWRVGDDLTLEVNGATVTDTTVGREIHVPSPPELRLGVITGAFGHDWTLRRLTINEGTLMDSKKAALKLWLSQ